MGRPADYWPSTRTAQHDWEAAVDELVAAGATPADIRQRAGRWAQTMGVPRRSPAALVKWWDELAPPVPRPPPEPDRAGAPGSHRNTCFDGGPTPEPPPTPEQQEASRRAAAAAKERIREILGRNRRGPLAGALAEVAAAIPKAEAGP
jgi:hypothetical protein